MVGIDRDCKLVSDILQVAIALIDLADRLDLVGANHAVDPDGPEFACHEACPEVVVETVFDRCVVCAHDDLAIGGAGSNVGRLASLLDGLDDHWSAVA